MGQQDQRHLRFGLGPLHPRPVKGGEFGERSNDPTEHVEGGEDAVVQPQCVHAGERVERCERAGVPAEALTRPAEVTQINAFQPRGVPSELKEWKALDDPAVLSPPASRFSPVEG